MNDGESNICWYLVTNWKSNYHRLEQALTLWRQETLNGYFGKQWRPRVCTDCSDKLIFRESRGQIVHSSACYYEWNLERTSNSSKSSRAVWRVLKSEGETSIFGVLTQFDCEILLSVYRMQLWDWLGKYHFSTDISNFTYYFFLYCIRF